MANRKTAAARTAPAAARAPERDVKDTMIMQLQNRLADMELRMNTLSAGGGMELLPPEEMPIFEVGPGGYYSADDCLYPEGVIIEDITGRMPLNEQLVPLNEPAEERLEMYLRSLPQHGTPSHEFVLEAAFRQLGDLAGNTGDRAGFFARVLEDAAKLRMTQLGLLPGQEAPRAASPRTAAERSHVPIMSNTRIRHDAGPLGHVPQAPLGRGAVQTRMRAPAAAPAHKAAPPMGTVASTNIGTAGQGATAG